MPNGKRGRPLPGTMAEVEYDKDLQERRDQVGELMAFSKCLAGLPEEWQTDSDSCTLYNQLVLAMSSTLSNLGYPGGADSTLQEMILQMRKGNTIPTSEEFCLPDLVEDLRPYWTAVDRAGEPEEASSEDKIHMKEDLVKLIAAATLAYEAALAESEK